ncbi:MAG TPA: hypothetical protein VFF30_18270 [Nitrososphaerales archaeon]|nr:hypothetical protein [Nitrososphaerales archaeon]
MIGFAIVFLIETYTQLGIGKFPVTTAIYAAEITRSGHLATVDRSQLVGWANYVWIDAKLPLPSILVTQIGLLTGLSPATLDFFPFCTLFLIGFYTFAFRITRSTWFSLFYVFVYGMVMLGFDNIEQINRTSLGWVYFGFLLMLLFTPAKGSKAMTFSTILILAATSLTYYTMAAFSLGVIICLVVYSQVSRRGSIHGGHTKSPFHTNPIMILIATVFFFQSSVLSIVLSSLPISNVYDFLSMEYQTILQSLAFEMHLTPQPVNSILNNLPLPPYLHRLSTLEIVTQDLLGLVVLVVALIGVVSMLARKPTILPKGDWRIAGSWAALGILAVNSIAYASLRANIAIGLLGLMGTLFVFFPRLRGRPEKLRSKVAKNFAYVMIILISAGSVVGAMSAYETGLVGTYPFDGSLYAPVSNWYGNYSSRSDIATGNVILSSVMALYSTKGQSIQALQYNLNISHALDNNNSAELEYSFKSLSSNVYVFTIADSQRASWGDVWGYVAPPMNYSEWFYDQPITNVVYSNKLTMVDYLGFQ